MSKPKIYFRQICRAIILFLSTGLIQTALAQPPAANQIPPYAGVEMFQVDGEPNLPYNFIHYYGNTITYFIDSNLQSFSIKLSDKMTYIINIKEYVDEAFSEWKEELHKLNIILNFEETNQKENANLIITTHNSMENCTHPSMPRGTIPLMGTCGLGRYPETTRAASLEIGTSETVLQAIQKLYQQTRHMFPSLDLSSNLSISSDAFIKTVYRVLFKHEIGHLLGLAHPDSSPDEGPTIRMINYDQEPPATDIHPPIMEGNIATYLDRLFAHYNGPRQPSFEHPTHLLNPRDVGIARQEAQAIARAVNWTPSCAPALFSLDLPDPTLPSANIPAPGINHRSTRSVSSSQQLSCPGTFDDIVAGDIRKIDVSKLINGVTYYLQTSLSNEGYYNTLWSKNTAHPLTMIALSNPTRMKNVPQELGIIDYVKVNLNDGYDHHKASLASYYYKGTGGYQSGVDSDAYDAIFLNTEQDLAAHTYGLIHYLVRIKGGNVAPDGERLFIMTGEHNPWAEPITLKAEDRLCWLTNYAMPKSDNNPHTGLSDGQYNAQFKCRKLNSIDPLYDQAEVSLSQEVIARGLDHFVKNRQILDLEKTYSAYVGMYNPQQGESYRGYCGWTTSSETDVDNHGLKTHNAKIDCGLTHRKNNISDVFQLRFSQSPAVENVLYSIDKKLSISITKAIEGRDWGLVHYREVAGDPQSGDSSSYVLPWLGSQEETLAFRSERPEDYTSFTYSPLSSGLGSLTDQDGHYAVQYSNASGPFYFESLRPAVTFSTTEHDLKIDYGYETHQQTAQPDPVIISIILKGTATATQ